jgi:hypothetical protein
MVCRQLWCPRHLKVKELWFYWNLRIHSDSNCKLELTRSGTQTVR